jgi:hypothetical protein
MTVERYIHIFAGLFILVSLALGIEGSPLFVSPWWLAFTAFRRLRTCSSSASPASARPASCCASSACRIPGRRAAVELLLTTTPLVKGFA